MELAAENPQLLNRSKNNVIGIRTEINRFMYKEQLHRRLVHANYVVN